MVEDISDSSDIDLTMNIENIDNLFSKEAEINIFRIIQECLNNISKHSKASMANVTIIHSDKRVEINVSDNGVGIVNSNGDSGLGLIGIKERVNFLNGKLEIGKNEPNGTSVKISIEDMKK